MTRYEARSHQNGWEVYDLHTGTWCFGTWSIHKETANRVAQKWNNQYRSAMA